MSFWYSWYCKQVSYSVNCIVASASLINVQSLAQIDVESYGCDKSKLYDAEEGL